MSAAERAAVDRLLRFADPLRGPGWDPLSPADPKLSVPRTRALLDLAGAPDRDLTCVLVAGTKGKGSTAAFIASVLAAAGIRAGLYTSPHLQSWRERIRVDGVAIRPQALVAAIDGALRLVPRLRRRALGEPSAFQLLTVAALSHFAARRCSVAVLEVGLGGRYDATNAVEPAVSVIASIGYDHQGILGRTLGRIAREKAGVLRRGRPGLLAPQRPAAHRALARACRESGARCRTVAPLPPRARLGLPGAHQRVNAGLAAAAVREIAPDIEGRAIERGLRALRWPGRIEIVPGDPDIVLDGAHTGESAAALAQFIAERYMGRALHVVFGCTADRDPRAILRPLLGPRTTGYATAAAGPRALPPELVARAFGAAGAATHPSVRDALDAAQRRAPASEVIVVTGSLAVVGEARSALGLPVPERLW